jgi:hypothetical protein
MLAVVTHLHDLVGRQIPIYMPAYDRFRKWNDDEKQLLHDNSVILVEANGELFLKINENAAAVSYRNWNPVKQVVADIAKPAVLICTPVSEDADQDFAYTIEERDGQAVNVPKVRARNVQFGSSLRMRD